MFAFIKNKYGYKFLYPTNIFIHIFIFIKQKIYAYGYIDIRFVFAPVAPLINITCYQISLHH